MAIDTGAEVTLINRKTYKLLGKPVLRPAAQKLTVANGTTLETAGILSCQVDLEGSQFTGDCYVTDNCSLLGLDWMKHEKNGQILNPKLISRRITTVQENQSNSEDSDTGLRDKIQKRFPSIVDGKLGKCTKYEAKITLKKSSTPIFKKARPVAYAILPAIAAEIERLESTGVIEKVNSSAFAAPVVVVRKSSGGIRLCADYSTGLNTAIEDDNYPLPTAEDIFSTLNGGTWFSKIDLSEAYLQIPVDAESQKLLTINTPKGLYRMKRLPFGIKTAPSIFQRLMDTLVADLEGTTAYLDDIIVTSKTKAEHENRILKLFGRLAEFGLKAQLNKCSFMKSQIQYLGFILSKEGRKPDPERIQPIVALQKPTNISQLRAFLGMITFYNNFVPDMAELREPLNKLLKKNTPFVWNNDCEKAFEKAKTILQSDLLLTHFNPNLPIIVSADASSYGLGCVIFHRFPDGSVKAVQHAARSLTETERKYAQIEKEALALVFAVRKFHKYLYGRKFTLNTDHKPLITIFKQGSGISAHAANRLQRWALILLDYTFDIQYKKTTDFGEADALSRLISIRQTDSNEEDKVIARVEKEIQAELQTSINRMPITAEQVRQESKKCSLLQAAMDHVSTGQWPKLTKENDLFNLYSRKDNLSIVDGCLIYNNRVVIPRTLKENILITLHEGHPGIARMKTLAREYVFWNNLDKDIEDLVRRCDQCQRAGKMPKKVPLEPWPDTGKPWKRVHADFAGPMKGVYYLIIVDSFSKWPEVLPTKKITAEATIELLDEVCSRYGYPEELVTDNGLQFAASTTKDFCVQRGIKQIFTAPYNPMSNGQAERFVDTFKRSFKKMAEEEGTPGQKIRTILRTYRSTPNRTINDKTPAELFVGRKLRSRMDLLRPSSAAKINSINAPGPSYRARMKNDFDRHQGAVTKTFEPEDWVYATQFRNNKTSWVPGVVKRRTGAVNYEVDIAGDLARKHANQLKKRDTRNSPSIMEIEEATLKREATESFFGIPDPKREKDTTLVQPRRPETPATGHPSTRQREPENSSALTAENPVEGLGDQPQCSGWSGTRNGFRDIGHRTSDRAPISPEEQATTRKKRSVLSHREDKTREATHQKTWKSRNKHHYFSNCAPRKPTMTAYGYRLARMLCIGILIVVGIWSLSWIPSGPSEEPTTQPPEEPSEAPAIKYATMLRHGIKLVG
ncbi:uncharacterized protein K02A2.6-like [Galendromus occidentalis]|uniref:RNA-directed DNA polymerase n=1 Tax=Galendromus occidentalis TaxID=34638 RepID=A0AAJ7SJT0_9ACAR|nr:uncharacterized protein K02A2.6-like [Galendromus occidentalis]